MRAWWGPFFFGILIFPMSRTPPSSWMVLPLRNRNAIVIPVSTQPTMTLSESNIDKGALAMPPSALLKNCWLTSITSWLTTQTTLCMT